MLTHLHSDIFPEAPPMQGVIRLRHSRWSLGQGLPPWTRGDRRMHVVVPCCSWQGANIRCAPVGLCPGICGCLPAVRHRGVSDGVPQLHVAAPAVHGGGELR